MTHNQIEYWNLQENKRHNLASEGETNRHNVSTESETYRHNVQSEATEIGKLNESVRHNMATEYETNRHNVSSENLGFAQLAETRRHNTATESLESMKNQVLKDNLAETVRHNKVSEHIQGTGVTAKGLSDLTKAGQTLIGPTTAVGTGVAAAKSKSIATVLKGAARKFSTFDPFVTIIPKGSIVPIGKNQGGISG